MFASLWRRLELAFNLPQFAGLPIRSIASLTVATTASARLIAGVRREADAAKLGELLEPRSDLVPVDLHRLLPLGKPVCQDEMNAALAAIDDASRIRID